MALTISLKKLTDRELAELLGQAHGQEKAARQYLTDLKEEFKRRDIPELAGKHYYITRTVTVRSYFDTDAAKKKLGRQWVEDHTTMQDVTAVHIRPTGV